MREFVLAGYIGGEINVEEVAEMLTEAAGEDIRVSLITEGGEVLVEKALNSMIRGYKGKKTVCVLGVCASAGTKLMMAFDEVEIDQDAYIMIHNPMGGVRGDAAKQKASAEFLQRIEDEYAEAYAAKTGLTVAKCKEMMKAETWLSAQEAFDLKFVDRIVKAMPSDVEAKTKIAACIGGFEFGKYKNVPSQIHAKIQKPTQGKNMDSKILALFPGLDTDAIVARVNTLTAAAAEVSSLKASLSEQRETVIQLQAKLASAEQAVTAAHSEMTRFKVAEVRAHILKEAGVEVSAEVEAKLDKRISAYLNEKDEARKAELREDAVIVAKAWGVPTGKQFASEQTRVQSPIALTGDANEDARRVFEAEYLKVKAANPSLSPTAWKDMAANNVKALKGAK